MTLNNREQVIEQLAEVLKQLDKESARYQTDVYMYIDENGIGTLDTFVNVGGNSWLNDNHYTIYCDREHLDAYNGYYDDADIDYFSEIIGISVEQLEQETREYLGWDDEDEITSANVFDYLTHTDTYEDKLQAEYESGIESLSAEYMERAEEIFSAFEEDQNE